MKSLKLAQGLLDSTLQKPMKKIAKLAVGEVAGRLEKVQTRLRQFSYVLPNDNRQALVPSMPIGHGVERFQDSIEALKSWADKQTQWWYFTGHLKTKAGREFGFQLVFFERHSHSDFVGALPARLLKTEYYVGHFAISNLHAQIGQRSHRYFQRGGLLTSHFGFASEERFHVDIEGWQAQQLADGTLSIRASEGGTTLCLKLQPQKALVRHGHRGYTAKNERIEDGSLYCTYTRMQAQGTLLLDGELHEVNGSSWMDHEKMSADDRIFHNGWDWYSIQLDNNEELMLYLLKDDHGNISEFAMGTFLDADGIAHALNSEDIICEKTKFWSSPRSKANYPVGSRIQIAKLELELSINARLDDQEMDTSKTAFCTYWEGVVHVEGHRKKQSVIGRGYLELVGYDLRPRRHVFRFLTKA